MKIFKLMAIALVAMLGFTACEKDCDHDFIEHDHSADLVGTWTCLQEGLADAFVIKADGSVVSTGVLDGVYWDGVKGSIKTVNNKMTFTFEGGDNYETRFDIIPGVAFSIFNEEGERLTYNYCANDLADEIVGMWVCTDGRVDVKDDMMIQTFNEDGSLTYTGYAPLAGGFTLNGEGTYKVIGDLAIINLFKGNLVEDASEYMIKKLIYSPMGTAMGDIITFKGYYNAEEMTTSWLRVKQNLDLAGKAYDYSATYISNVKGLDEDMTMMGYTFNIGKMEGKNLDKMLKHLLFAVEFPNANTIKYQYHYNGQNLVFEAPIGVDGKKLTIKMSEFSSYYRDVDMYMYQDKDNTQLHMYMPTYAFINYFANMDLAALAFAGEIDLTDEAAVKAIFDRMDERVESINVSFVLKARK